MTTEQWREYQLMLMECYLLNTSPKRYLMSEIYILNLKPKLSIEKEDGLIREYEYYPPWQIDHPLKGVVWGDLENLILIGEFWGLSWADTFLWKVFRESASAPCPSG